MFFSSPTYQMDRMYDIEFVFIIKLSEIHFDKDFI